MQLNLRLHQNVYHAVVFILMLISGGCKNRNTIWRETLTKQISQSGQIRPLDSALNVFMVDYHVPAVSIAVAKGREIVYFKTFGLADFSKAEEANNESLFRIAGLSTTITSLAIRKLVALGQISYDSKLFGKGSIFGTQYGHKPYGTWLTEVTIEDLINHTSGGWSGADDVMDNTELRGLLITKDSALSWILDQTPLKAPPGSTFNFSFTGFFILGMVIEKITGRSYEEWTKENILQPSGITDMEVEKDGSQHSHQVNNYRDMKWPLNNGDIDEHLHLSKADAALGWIASANDLIKLMLKFRNTDSLDSGKRPNGSLAVLRPLNIRPGYSPDWCSRSPSGNWWEQFDFYGTTSILVQSSKGFCWAVLINTNRPAIEDYFPDIDSVITKTMDNTTIRWSLKQER